MNRFLFNTFFIVIISSISGKINFFWGGGWWITWGTIFISFCISFSFSIYIPVVIICGLGFNFAQWILLLYAACSSTSFIIVNFWREMGKYVDKMRLIIIIVIICGQICLFSIMKFYFFEKFEEEVTNNNIIKTFNNTDSNSTNSSANWF